MKQLILACALASTVSLAYAADAAPAKPAQSTPKMCHDEKKCCHGMGKHHNAADHSAQLKTRLNLTDDQTAKIKAVFEKTDQQRTTIHEKYKPQLDALHADMSKLHDQTHTDISAILTPEQRKKFDALPKPHRCGKDGDGMPMHGDMSHQHDHMDKSNMDKREDMKKMH